MADIYLYPTSGSDITLRAPGAPESTYALTAETGVFALTGKDAGWIRDYALNAQTGMFALIGYDAQLRLPSAAVVDTGYHVTHKKKVVKRQPVRQYQLHLSSARFTSQLRGSARVGRHIEVVGTRVKAVGSVVALTKQSVNVGALSQFKLDDTGKISLNHGHLLKTEIESLTVSSSLASLLRGYEAVGNGERLSIRSGDASLIVSVDETWQTAEDDDRWLLLEAA